MPGRGREREEKRAKKERVRKKFGDGNLKQGKDE